MCLKTVVCAALLSLPVLALTSCATQPDLRQLRIDKADNQETAFRYAHEENIGVFYWIDGPFGYALTGDLKKHELLRVAQLVYQQLNP